MIKIKELLPIGSIVLLKNASKKIMIFGIKQTNNDDGKEYDYVGVVYPEGNLGLGFQYVFDHENIEKVISRGYEDEERAEFINTLQKAWEQADNKDR